jgi:hypothetical protein
MEQIASKEVRYLLYWVILSIAPEVAFAGGPFEMIPTVLVTMPIFMIMLVGIIITEVGVIQTIIPEAKFKTVVINTSLGNLASTLVGIPLAWVLYILLITLPAMFLFTPVIMVLPDYATNIIGYIVSVPIITSLDYPMLVCGNFLMLMLPTYIVTSWIKYRIIAYREGKNNEVMKALPIANRWSCLLVVVCTILAFVFKGKEINGLIESFLNIILNN